MAAAGTTVEAGINIPSDASGSGLLAKAEVGRPQKKKRLRSLTRQAAPRPPRSELERACRIALLETEQPESVESIYERIVRRESLQFFSYKRPFQVIASAMSTLVRRGEAILLVQKTTDTRDVWRQRLWCRAAADTTSKQLTYNSR